MHVLVVADGGDSDPGWVGERLRERGDELRTALRGGPDVGLSLLHDTGLLHDTDLVLLLGSASAVYDPRRAEVVQAESALVRAAVQTQTPVLGICYGAQLAAHALGGSVRPVEHGEVGWFAVSSADEQLCPPGPWLQFHSDVFTPPPGARVLGESTVGPQGFATPGVLAWQFHPETTPSTLGRWVRAVPAYVVRHGNDPQALVAETERRAPAAREAAYRLVDAALEHLQL